MKKERINTTVNSSIKRKLDFLTDHYGATQALVIAELIDAEFQKVMLVESVELAVNNG